MWEWERWQERGKEVAGEREGGRREVGEVVRERRRGDRGEGER